ncbi:MAG: rod shape-determining protein [Clostridiales bacterium]|nr:rod shape-determining protein [Clostridiales bacterium]
MLGVNIGIDLGTTSVVVYVEGKGLILSEPTAVAYNTESGKLIAIGKKAKKMQGKNPSSIRVVLPMSEGVISDFSATRHIVSYFVKRICGNMVFKPNLLVCLPATVTGLEKRTLLDLAITSGAGRACLIEEPLAAALGAGVEIDKPKGTMVVDIGGGTTDIAVITLGSVAISKTVRVAGNAWDESIIRYLRNEKALIVGSTTAEMVKNTIGCAYLHCKQDKMIIKGKDYVSGLPKSAKIAADETYLAMRENLEHICSGIISVLESTPPELAGDLMESGIILTGGGALLRGIDSLIADKTGVKTHIAEDPLTCVVRGMGRALSDYKYLERCGFYYKTAEEVKGYKE